VGPHPGAQAIGSGERTFTGILEHSDASQTTLAEALGAMEAQKQVI
jgi:20S proteasome alpha/beta subunit